MRETKTFPLSAKTIDVPGRTLEAYAAAFANVDEVGDIIHPGAFTKTITERGTQVKLLWQHKADEPIGKIVAMREDPAGLFLRAVISETARGNDAVALLRDGAISEMSIGYDPVVFDYTTKEGKTIRNLREVKLYEVSLVTFPANPDAVVTSLKAVGPSEGKPWNVFKEGDEYAVYKVDADGKPTGKPLGKHPSEARARRQVRALFASEGKSVNLGKQVSAIRQAFDEQFNPSPSTGPFSDAPWLNEIYDDHLTVDWKNSIYQLTYRLDDAGKYTFASQSEWVRGAMTFVAGAKMVEPYGEIKVRKQAGARKTWGPMGPQKLLGETLQSRIHMAFTDTADFLYADGFLNTDERILLSGAIGAALEVLVAKVPADIMARRLEYPFTEDQARVSPPGQPEVAVSRMADALSMLETKAGRVLARRNAERVRAALEAITEVLKDAGLFDDVEDEPEAKPEAKPEEKLVDDETTRKLKLLEVEMGDMPSV